MPPRPLRPKDDPSIPEGSETATDIKVGKRRAIPTACIPCRKRKSKCDGSLPSCSTCTAVYFTECNYDADGDHQRKGALQRKPQYLQQRNDALDVIVASLRNLPEVESIALLHSLRGNTNPDVLAASLRTNARPPHTIPLQTLEADFAQQVSHSTPISPISDSVPYLSSGSCEQLIDDGQMFSKPATPADSPASWFRVPQDAEFVEHLLNLYFVWIHPFHCILSRDHFLYDMGSGRTDYCSAMLVNAILSFACHYSERPLARSDPESPATAGDAFFTEAKRLLDKTEKACLTTVQALGVMSIRECSHGRDSNAYHLAGRCVRMALELGLHLAAIGNGLSSADLEVRKLVFWGVFNLETIYSVGFGRLSQLPRSAADTHKPSIDDRTDNQTWRPYQDANLALSTNSSQPARPMLFVDRLSKLCELASDMVNTFYAAQEHFTSRRLAATYGHYQEWYQNLPDTLRLENTSLPHVLVLHMYYHACVLHLFQPYIKLDLRGANLLPHDTCTFCANEISASMNTLRATYGLRRVCLAVISLLLSASTIHLLNLPSDQSAANLSQALQDLQAMSVNHQFAARCVKIIRGLATKWNIALPEETASVPVFGNYGQRPWASPLSSTFSAASIPRQESTESGASWESSVSGSGHRDSAFAPPTSQQSHGQQSPFPSCYNDPQTPLDATQSQNASIILYPVQGEPWLPQNFNIMMLDSANMDMPHQQGHVFDASTGPPETTQPASHSTPVWTDDKIRGTGASFAERGWQ